MQWHYIDTPIATSRATSRRMYRAARWL